MNNQSGDNKIKNVTKDHLGEGYQILTTKKPSSKKGEFWLFLTRYRFGNEADSKSQKIFYIIMNSLNVAFLFFMFLIIPIFLVYLFGSSIIKILIEIFT